MVPTTSKTLGSFTLPVLPVNTDDENAEAKETLLAALKEAKTSQECRLGVIKAKLNHFHIKNTPPGSTRPTQPPLGPKLPKKLANPSTKNMECHYCGIKGHFQLDWNSYWRNGTPMVRANGIWYSQCSF
jgi:hypothetical protein